MLLLPLLGGYIFVRFWRYTWIHVLRSDKERLIIRASLAGLASLILTYFVYIVFSTLLPCKEDGVCIASWWAKNVPFEYSGISLSAFFVAALAWIPLNYFFPEKKQIDRAIKEDADPFEILLKRAQDESIEVAITMTSGTVYIGFITHKFNPVTPTNFIGMLPIQSGYRDEITKRVNLTTPYALAYEAINSEVDVLEIKIYSAKKKLEVSIKADNQNDCFKITNLIEQLESKKENLEKKINRFGMTIPVSQIASVNLYDTDVHQKYFLAPYDQPVIDNIPPEKQISQKARKKHSTTPRLSVKMRGESSTRKKPISKTKD